MTDMMHELSVMDKSQGDFKVRWNPDDQDSVANAREQFNDLVGRGFNLFRINRESGRRTGEQISEFDAAAMELLAVPAVQGG